MAFLSLIHRCRSIKGGANNVVCIFRLCRRCHCGRLKTIISERRLTLFVRRIVRWSVISLLRGYVLSSVIAVLILNFLIFFLHTDNQKRSTGRVELKPRPLVCINCNPKQVTVSSLACRLNLLNIPSYPEYGRGPHQ